ncbi:hypothetical protein Tco_1181731, partial [Tanacetum coccineum]
MSDLACEDHTLDRSLENTFGDPIMQFVVQNFEQINVMYSAFSSKRKELNPTSAYNNDDHPVVEPWRPTGNADFYNKSFTLTETQENVRNLVASPFTTRIRDYDMPDGLKVPTNIKTYDDESLRDYFVRFGKETLHMTDRSDMMMTEAFISRLRPG